MLYQMSYVRVRRRPAGDDGGVRGLSAERLVRAAQQDAARTEVVQARAMGTPGGHRSIACLAIAGIERERMRIFELPSLRLGKAALYQLSYIRVRPTCTKQ